MLTLAQDVPVLSPVLQKGAYWRLTCFVLFDDPTDEDSGIRILSCARLSRNRVCVCVWVWVWVSVCVFVCHLQSCVFVHRHTHDAESSQRKNPEGKRGTAQLSFSSGHQNNVDIVMKARRLSAVQAHEGCRKTSTDPPSPSRSRVQPLPALPDREPVQQTDKFVLLNPCGLYG